MIHLTNFHSTAKLYSAGDCNSHQSRPEKKKICENWYALQYFSLPHPAHVIQRRGMHGGELTASCALDEKGRRAASCSNLRHAPPFTKVRARQVLYVQTLDSRLVVSSQLLYGLAVHIRALRLLCILSVRIRCVEIGRCRLLCYPMVYPPMMRSSCLLGHFPSTCTYCRFIIRRVVYVW